MERKLLWIISSIVIFILWIKIEPQGMRDVSTASKSSETTAEKGSSSDQAAASKEGEEYFKEHPLKGDKPDFAAMTDVKARKEAFFAFLTPYVNEKNDLLMTDRARIKAILANNEPPSREDKAWLAALRSIHKLRKLGVYTHADIEVLLKYVDIIPASMVLAQAANESAWGTSRFAVEGNNYFGQWCFSKGCGLVPNSRGEDQDHEVRKFNDPRESVFAYIDNLNSNPAYKELRNIRAQLRAQNKNISGLALVHGLENYSQRGQDYIDEIESLIDYNELWRFNVHGQETAYNNE